MVTEYRDRHGNWRSGEDIDEAVRVIRDLGHRDATERWATQQRTWVPQTPDDVIGQRGLVLAGALGSAVQDGVRWSGLPEGMPLRELTEIVKMAMDAPTFLWTEEILAQLVPHEGPSALEPLPPHVVSPNVLFAPRMWWTHSASMEFVDIDEGMQCELAGAFLWDRGTSFGCMYFADLFEERDDLEDDTMTIIGWTELDYAPYPYEALDDKHNLVAGSILRELSFLNSPYIAKSQHKVSRPVRRTAQREGNKTAANDVTFVDLRRIVQRKSESKDSSRLYKHRWVVRGHHRAQWYPSEQAHHLRWIPPYVKGPEDAPMVEHVYRVKR